MESRAAARRARVDAQLAIVERVLSEQKKNDRKENHRRRKRMEHTLKFNKQRVSAM